MMMCMMPILSVRLNFFHDLSSNENMPFVYMLEAKYDAPLFVG